MLYDKTDKLSFTGCQSREAVKMFLDSDRLFSKQNEKIDDFTH